MRLTQHFRLGWFAAEILAILIPNIAYAGETLQDAWATALVANQGFQASRMGIAAAQNDLTAATRERIPSIHTLNTQTFLSQTPTFKINTPQFSSAPGGGTINFPFLNQNFFLSSTLMTIPVYTGGRIPAGIDRSAAAVDVAHATTETSVLDLKLNVAKAFLTVLRSEKMVLLQESSEKNLEAHVRDVQSKFDEGVANRNDLLSVQVSLARSRQRVIQARNDLETAKASYNQLLGRPLDAPVRLDEVPLSQAHTDPTALASAGDLEPLGRQSSSDEAQIERLTQTALRNRPELAGLSAQAATHNAEARLADSARMPQLGVVGGYTFFENSHFTNPNFFSGSIVAQWTLFDGQKSRHRAEALRIKEAQTLRMRQDAASLIALSIRQVWETIRSDRARLTVAQAAIDRAQENLRVTRDRYHQQVGTNTEVLDAETLRVQTYTDYYNVFYDLVLDGFNLRRAVGDL